MTSRRSAFILGALTLSWMLCGSSGAQKSGDSSNGKQRVLSLDVTNSGREVAATVGQTIQVTLGTIGPGSYGTPEVSSPAIHFDDYELMWPPTPGGPVQIYIFRAAAQGKAEIQIPHCNSEPFQRPTFVVTLEVGPATGPSHGSPSDMTPDQANTTPWTKGWTNLAGSVRQTFTPTLPRLTAVEVELVVANPGPPNDVTMTLLDEGGRVLRVVTKPVPVADSGRVLFVLANDGLKVTPGKVYSIQVDGDSVFGWKYVAGGYENGAALLNGKPLSRNRRSTFLFRTFGAN
jgi:hypothetical protein